jgi:anaerobic selenocysteine-containing dehydrogenase
MSDGAPTEADRAEEAVEVRANKAHLGNVLPRNDPDSGARLEPLPGEATPAVAAPAMDPPAMIRFRPGAATPKVPPVDAYSLRLVASRTLYDAGVLVQRSPALAGLAGGPTLRVNPADLGRMGVTTGDRVRVSSSRTSLVLDVAADARVTRGSAVLVFNAPGEGAADLIDVSEPVTDVRIETVKGA